MRRLIKNFGGKMHFQTNLISKSSMIIAFCTNTKNMYNIYLFKTFCTFNNNVWLCRCISCYVLARLAALHSNLTWVTYIHIINLNQLDKMLFSSCMYWFALQIDHRRFNQQNRNHRARQVISGLLLYKAWPLFMASSTYRK